MLDDEWKSAYTDIPGLFISCNFSIRFLVAPLPGRKNVHLRIYVWINMYIAHLLCRIRDEA